MATDASKKVVIQIGDVTKSFKDLCAVNQVSFNIHEGEYVALLGPNGAGKTTLIEMIEGIQQPDSGKIQIFGETWKTNAVQLRKAMGIALQETQLQDKLTVEETLNLFASFYKVTPARCLEILEWLNLGKKRKSFVVNLSGGQKQKLVLGIALIHKPQILLLDEPTTGLDPNARREIWGLLDSLKKEGKTLVLTTHYMEEAEYLCERILIMDKGNIIAEGSLNDLLELENIGETITFMTSPNELTADAFKAITGVIDVKWQSEQRLGKLHVKDIAQTLPLLLRLLEQEGVVCHQLECRKKNLEDVFIAQTGRHLNE